ncbi:MULTISPECIES: sensor domain-containing diguanylate cyclase [Halomonas]|uniref:diguanylate cyclase n=1 Tax=Halomonas chromatireducens TaxID=507626 RepID=A0A0X8HB85_9GAMM|nr:MULTISPECIES: sensor domain-containing diguanylate cyclase [Halomonas]AMC99458.1 putative diguanylate cyclase AdrA [Halomonas chromatireducens]MBZ0329657.1 GGDEF domain-containing protein [Halomonas sp. ANAO-440]
MAVEPPQQTLQSFHDALMRHPLIRELWNHFPENMFLVRVEDDGHFTVEAANPAQLDTVGRECLGQPLPAFMPAASAEAIYTRYRECVARDKPMRYQEHAVFFDEHGNEQYGYWLTLIVPLHNAAEDPQRVTHIFGISQDVTELHQAREALERHNQALEARVEQRTAELQHANRELRLLNAQLEEMATRDFLTGCYNRRHIETLGQREIERARRYDTSLSVLMVDLDAFKQVNDTQGHDAGDAALKCVAASLQNALRANDLLGRFGGDEFLILLPESNNEDARVAAKRLQQLTHEQTDITISVGIATLRRDDTLESLAARADQRLLAAKREYHRKASG